MTLHKIRILTDTPNVIAINMCGALGGESKKNIAMTKVLKHNLTSRVKEFRTSVVEQYW